MKVKLRYLSEKDIKDLVQLHRLIFNSNISEEVFIWKYLKSETGLNYSIVAEFNEKIVGFYGCITRYFSCKEENRVSGLIADVMVSPEFRGLFSKKKNLIVRMIMKLIKEQIITSEEEKSKKSLLFPYGFPMERHYKLGKLLGFYKDIDKTLDVETFPERKNFSLYRIKTSSILLKDITEKLWKNMVFSEICLNCRDYKILSWRYSHPGKKFEFHYIYKLWFPVALIITEKESNKVYDYVGDLRIFAEVLKFFINKKNRSYKVRIPASFEHLLSGIKYKQLSSVPVVTYPGSLLVKVNPDLKVFFMYGDEDL